MEPSRKQPSRPRATWRWILAWPATVASAQPEVGFDLAFHNDPAWLEELQWGALILAAWGCWLGVRRWIVPRPFFRRSRSLPFLWPSAMVASVWVAFPSSGDLIGLAIMIVNLPAFVPMFLISWIVEALSLEVGRTFAAFCLWASWYGIVRYLQSYRPETQEMVGLKIFDGEGARESKAPK